MQTQLDAKQAVELEIEQLKGTLNVMKHMGDDGDMEILKKVEDIHESLREKEGEYEYLEALNQTLIVKERKSNDELQDARKELVNVSLFLPSIFSIIFLYFDMPTLPTNPFCFFLRPSAIVEDFLMGSGGQVK